VVIGDRAKIYANNLTGENRRHHARPAGERCWTEQAGDYRSPQCRRRVLSKLGIKGGVMVTNVRPGSFADENNLEKGAVNHGDQPEAGNR